MGKFKNGQKCKVVKSTAAAGGSNYGSVCVGTPVTIISDAYPHGGKIAYNVSTSTYSSGGYMYEDELAPFSLTREELNSDIEKLQAEIEEVKSKINFLEVTGLDEFDDEEFKAFEILKVIGIDDIQKARQIVKLLNNK